MSTAWRWCSRAGGISATSLAEGTRHGASVFGACSRLIGCGGAWSTIRYFRTINPAAGVFATIRADVALILTGAARQSFVGRATHTEASTIEHMGVDHRRADIGVSEQFLNRSDVVAVFEQVSGEGVVQSVATGSFGDASSVDRLDLGKMCTVWVMTARQKLRPAVGEPDATGRCYQASARSISVAVRIKPYSLDSANHAFLFLTVV